MSMILAIALLFVLLPFGLRNVKKTAMLIFACPFIILAFFLYAQWGALDQLKDTFLIQNITSTLDNLTQEKKLSSQQVLDAFKNLEHHIEKSHYALGQLASLSLELGFFEYATSLYDKAIALDPNQFSYWQEWIYAQSQQYQGTLPLAARQKAHELIKLDPSQYALINIIAIDDYLHEDYQAAIKNWRQLIRQDQSLTPERRAVIQRAIVAAKSHLPHDSAISFHVNVSMAPELQTQVKPNDAIFVFVKSSQGSTMPLYVIKKAVSDLPLIIKLDDQQSMVDDVDLRIGMSVHVVAKVSKSGDPLDKQGDLRGISENIMLKSGVNPVKLVINEKLVS